MSIEVDLEHQVLTELERQRSSRYDWRLCKRTHHELELLIHDDILEPAQEAVGGDQEIPGCCAPTEDVLCQVGILTSVDNEEAGLCELKPIMQSICPLFCIVCY